MNEHQRSRPTTLLSLVATTLVAGLVSCDLTVSNPGPVEDSFLDLEPAHAAMINGAARAFNISLIAGEGMSLGLGGSCLAREWHPTGQTGTFACSLQVLRHQLTPDGTGSTVDRGQWARWIAEHAVRRIKEVRGDDGFQAYELAPRALLYVGYSNRILGEHVCSTVIDGGSEQSFMVHFERAEQAFTEAVQIAQTLQATEYEHAALAGRASVRIWLGDWAGAQADAAQVPKNFNFVTPFNKVDRSQYNVFHHATHSDGLFRNFTLWHTFYGENFDEFNDPRTPYRKFPEIPDRFGQGAVADLGDGRGALGSVDYWAQRKHTDDDAPVNLSSGREAMLIIAEGRLRDGDWQGALAIINEIRSEVGVALRDASDASEAWTWLKLEKLIELWLEGRALGERRRWLGDGTDSPAPGPLPALLRMDDRFGTDRCFPISQLERDTNPNL